MTRHSTSLHIFLAALLAMSCSKHEATGEDNAEATDPCIKLIENGGFEHGLAHWTANDGVGVFSTNDGPITCYSGDKCAGLAHNDNDQLSVLSQRATIPIGGGTTSLRFVVQRSCPGPNASDPNEFQRARILDPSGAELLQVFSHCVDHGTVWESRLVDLTPFAGRQIVVEFAVSTLADPPTSMIIDSVQLENHPDEGVVNGCGQGSCDGNPECESCMEDGECSDGPDPVWTGTGCACGDVTPTNCALPFCCAAGAHWEPTACEHGYLNCVPDGFVNVCGVGSCNGNPDCEACLQEAGCASGPDPVWTGSECACPVAMPRDNCLFPYCCASGMRWDPTSCACVP